MLNGPHGPERGRLKAVEAGPRFILAIEELPGYRMARTPHIEFFFPEGEMDEGDFAFMEGVLVESAQKLGVPLPVRPLRFYKHKDEPTKRALTGCGGNAMGGYSMSPKHGRIAFVHTIHRRDRHEITHVLMNDGHLPATWLAEGIAMFMTGRWGEEALDEVVRRLIAQGTYVPIARLFRDPVFGGTDEALSYPEVGAFVGFLVQRRGLRTFVDLYKKAPRTVDDGDAARLRELFVEVYGSSLEKMEEHWLRELGR